VKNHQDAALWVIWLRATTTKNQGKQLSAHHSKYNVLHLDIMKQAFCHKNWTVPNCHVTEIDFSKTWKQASKQAKSNTFKWWTGSFWFSAATRIEGYMQTGYSIRKRQVNPLAAFLALAFVRDQQPWDAFGFRR
jgi:hypothetical protein